ncbi:MAG: relaxase domain-containing protein [Candidatus Didemnitutus sp.]|nr:relaxase domain-containing protein [Candidatus Didemnitutus sp.]
MKALLTRKKPRHRGSLRTTQRVRYVEAALADALADPEIAGYVALLGGVFQTGRGKQVTTEHLSRALAARHPATGALLRARVNTGTRREGNSFVSNVCHGFDIPLAVDKSVSIAALVFGDKTVLGVALGEMQKAAKRLGRLMDRRLRERGQNVTAPTRKSSVFFLPEKAGRDGQPQLHAHLIFANLTTFEEAGRVRYCAGHFQRIAKAAMSEQRRMNREVSRRLKIAGYAVQLVDGVCRLPSVSLALCAQLSPVSRRLHGERNAERNLRRRAPNAEIRRREDAYLKERPKKVLQPLASWQAQWERVIGTEKIKAEASDYRGKRYNQRSERNDAPARVEPILPTALPAAAAIRSGRIPDDAVDDRESLMPRFDLFEVGLRQRLEEGLSHEVRRQVVELDYVCPEKVRDLVEHTEALRTLLRLIFPRLIVHQKFTSAERTSFRVKGAAAGNSQISQLITAAASALDAALGRDTVRSNWSEILRWLHTELANLPTEQETPVGDSATAPAEHHRTPRREKSQTAAAPSESARADAIDPAPAIDQEWEMMP